MMRTGWTAIILQCLTFANMAAEVPRFAFEGILGSPSENINNMNQLARCFLPYNPVVVEIGAYTGTGTLGLAADYPYGTIFAFEPHPEAFALLSQEVQFLKNVEPINLAVNTVNGSAELWGDDAWASFFHQNAAQYMTQVPCVALDDWCQRKGISRIDFLRLDVGGMEWPILQSSPEILDTVLVLVTKTYLSTSQGSIVLFPLFKSLLEHRGFTLLGHWYEGGVGGEAIFVRTRLYNALFN